jgi:hypothetical protein
LIFDPVTKDFENVTVDVQTDIWKFIWAVYTPEWKVVATPHWADYVLIFDPVTYEYEKVTMPTGYSWNSRRTWWVVTREWKVVFIPAKSDTIVIFDPIAKTFDTVNSGSTWDYKRQWGTLDPSTWNVIFYSNAANKMLHFNPTTKAIATYGLWGNYPVWWTITKEWKIVLAPCNYNDIIIYDVTTHTVQKIATWLTWDKKFSWAVYTKEWNVVFIPNHYSKILMLNISPSLTQPQPIEDFINAYVNKY